MAPMSRIFELGSNRAATVTDVAEVTRRYCAMGYTSEAAVVSAFSSYVTANSLGTIGGMILDQVDPTEMDESQDDWFITATWKPFRQKAPTPATETLSAFEDWFDLGLSTETVFKPIGSQIVTGRDPEDPIPAIALIGDQGDGKPPTGVPLMVPEITFGGTRYVKQSAWSVVSANTVLRLIGKVNTTSFMGWDIGEVLCAGISGSRRGRDDIELQFRFRVRENVTVETDGFPDIDKLGWQYLWPRHQLEYDGTSFVTTNTITHLVLANVFPTTSFTALE